MDTRLKIIASCAAAVTIAGGVTAGTVAAGAAPAAPAVHTIRLVAHLTGSHQYNRHAVATTEVDRRAGKIVGYNILHEHFTKTGGLITGAVVRQRGLIYFRIPLTAKSGPVFTGTLTGGANAFKGVRGTITARNLNNAGTKTKVIINYHH
jgi:hypothetical protein